MKDAVHISAHVKQIVLSIGDEMSRWQWYGKLEELIKNTVMTSYGNIVPFETAQIPKVLFAEG